MIQYYLCHKHQIINKMNIQINKIMMKMMKKIIINNMNDDYKYKYYYKKL